MSRVFVSWSVVVLLALPAGLGARDATEPSQQPAEEAERHRPDQLPRELRNSVGMEFVLLAPGTFEMGSPSDEPGRDDDETLHRVTLSQPLYLGKYEVTQDQWEAVMGDNPRISPRVVARVRWRACRGRTPRASLRS